MQLLSNTQECIAFGKTYAQQHHKILLHGELGAGKTTLSQGLVAGRGEDARLVQSPTYTYLHEYAHKILHIDMRRIESKEQLIQLGILELIDSYDYVIIERPKWTELYTDSSRSTLTLTKTETGRILESKKL